MKKYFSIFTYLTLSILVLSFGMITVQAEDGGPSISIPSIGVVAPIIDAPFGDETWDVSHLRMNVARLQGMPWFGSNTNVVLAGHSVGTEGNPDIFYNLNAMNIGDKIFVYVGGIEYTYVVTEMRNVSQTDLSILYPTDHSQLTLFTCDVNSYSAGTYLRRTVVIATQE